MPAPTYSYGKGLGALKLIAQATALEDLVLSDMQPVHENATTDIIAYQDPSGCIKIFKSTGNTGLDLRTLLLEP